MGKGKKTGRSCGNEDCNIVRLTIWHPIVTWATCCYESKDANIIWYEGSEVSESLWPARTR